MSATLPGPYRAPVFTALGMTEPVVLEFAHIRTELCVDFVIIPQQHRNNAAHVHAFVRAGLIMPVIRAAAAAGHHVATRGVQIMFDQIGAMTRFAREMRAALGPDAPSVLRGAAADHGRLLQTVRDRARELWLRGAAFILLCTTAYLAGVNRLHVRDAFYVGVIATLTAVEQYLGRTGRDGQRARLTVVSSMEEVRDAIQLAHSTFLKRFSALGVRERRVEAARHTILGEQLVLAYAALCCVHSCQRDRRYELQGWPEDVRLDAQGVPCNCRVCALPVPLPLVDPWFAYGCALVVRVLHALWEHHADAPPAGALYFVCGTGNAPGPASCTAAVTALRQVRAAAVDADPSAALHLSGSHLLATFFALVAAGAFVLRSRSPHAVGVFDLTEFGRTLLSPDLSSSLDSVPLALRSMRAATLPFADGPPDPTPKTHRIRGLTEQVEAWRAEIVADDQTRAVRRFVGVATVMPMSVIEEVARKPPVDVAIAASRGDLMAVRQHVESVLNAQFATLRWSLRGLEALLSQEQMVALLRLLAGGYANTVPKRKPR